ncbi:peptide chain release factor N(5)-glutamine methyltransferase [Aliihoeflea sp. PC F10.4]
MAETIALAEAIRRAREKLEAAGLDSAALDARLIVEHVTGTTRLDLIARPDMQIPEAHGDEIEAMLARRIAREPVHRILGEREFYGLRMTLSAQTLEPRPDTETLVEAVLPFARERAGAGRCRVLDLGTGTGAILIALLAHVPEATGLAADISGDALETAARNADLNGVAARFETVQSDWFSSISGRFDLIVSNPPYIASSDVETLAAEVRIYDPQRALDGGDDGLDCYRAIARKAADHLTRAGRVAVEIGYDQKDVVSDLFGRHGFICREARQDLGKNDRVLIFEPDGEL